VKKTSVYLAEEHLAALRRTAELEQRSQSEVLREAIRAYLSHVERPRSFAMSAVAEGPGGSVADLPEKELLKGFGA
jgi:hypothetical protein